MNKTVLGAILMVISMAAYGVVNPLLKKAGLNSFATMIVQIAVLWLSVLPFFIVSRSYQNVFDNKNAILILALAGIINAFGYFLLMQSFNYLPIWQINTFWVLIPLFGAVASFFILGEVLSVNLLIGLVFIGAGFLIAFR
ncbi:DMT family transporter [Patescibacteria group bacterium]|nr:DMT family transporter [Patescibacteria group bacterium]MCL5797898.1 DMT family transporter [Patescibacteria group bacterium]